jgi:ribosomal protein S18 acetylase RimI-like enzyme
MTYTHRPATPEDAAAIAPLWQAFASDRARVDPSIAPSPDFNFERYIQQQLGKPLSFGWVLEQSDTPETSENPENSAIVGCLMVYFYDEAPPPDLPEEFATDELMDNPFRDRRIGSVLGLYVQPEHRQPDAIQLLANAGIQKAQEMKVNDIDILVGADQTGLHALLERFGFTKAAVQYTKHYEIDPNTDLPSLHPPHPELEATPDAEPDFLPLKDPKTGKLVKNPAGEPAFLKPLRNEAGKLYRASDDRPIYPVPVRDPQTQGFVFNNENELVTCPILLEPTGLVTYQGIPQFCPPDYTFQDGKLRLQQDSMGQYLFRDAKRDPDGKVLRDPKGKPIF